jgi:hypothetical protein
LYSGVGVTPYYTLLESSNRNIPLGGSSLVD